jgi:large subunit ribosomal protein L3
MANEQPGLLGRKLGMTQIFDANDQVVPCTVIEIGENTVIRAKTADSADGYTAVQLGFGDQKEARFTKPQLGHFAANNVKPSRWVREIRLAAADLGKYPVGGSVGVADIFTEGQKVDVIGVSKGRGFAGVMKKYNFKGFIRSHGTHEYFRHGGSIGTRLTPGHVIKGKKMPGHMGAANVTVQNLKLVKVDAERGLVFVAGGVPGPNGGHVTIRTAVKS